MLFYHLFFYGMVVICLIVAFKSVKYFIKAMRGQKLATIILSAFSGILAAHVLRAALYVTGVMFIAPLIYGPWYPFYHNYPLTFMIILIYTDAAAQFGLIFLVVKFFGKLWQRWFIPLLVVCAAFVYIAVFTIIPLVEYRVGLIVDFFIN